MDIMTMSIQELREEIIRMNSLLEDLFSFLQTVSNIQTNYKIIMEKKQQGLTEHKGKPLPGEEDMQKALDHVSKTCDGVEASIMDLKSKIAQIEQRIAVLEFIESRLKS
eukprot:TRINITY_DN15910_c0_g1_i1.p1 TRINITY_DN15910_c0_g1~~TRINITY_DN15910_c0_g1_i1.p1  ORF type:complete len:109 (+),score=22.88 TRINITY_DN15910_c0_g1_i1:119-445(+)